MITVAGILSSSVPPGHSPVFRVKVPASCGAAQSAVSAAPALVLEKREIIIIIIIIIVGVWF